MPSPMDREGSGTAWLGRASVMAANLRREASLAKGGA